MTKRMTLEEFRHTVKEDAPPAVTAALVALWHDARGNWGRAHEVAQDVEEEAGAWVHAYLHRKEGDLSNAQYWYRRAGRPESTDTLEAEWNEIVSALLLRDASG